MVNNYLYDNISEQVNLVKFYSWAVAVLEYFKGDADCVKTVFA